jgi:arylsulfatase A-like enzyme
MSCTERRPNVVIYVVDALRADALGTYGNRVVATPALDQLAAEGVLFENAAAPSSWTRPSMTSLLTGLNPDRHGVLTRIHALAPELGLLSEAFREAGYATGAFVTNPNLGHFYGFARGWDDYVELYARDKVGRIEPSELVTRSDQLNVPVFEWLERTRQPFLLLVFSIDPHWPYTPSPQSEQLIRRRLRGSKLDVPGDVRGRLRRYYAEVAFNDQSFGRLLDQLRRHGLYQETIVLFTSDHGEEFLEHGHGGHGWTLYEPAIRVPLVLRAPGRVAKGTRVSTRVGLADIFPTLLDLAEIPAPPGLDGRSLLEQQPTVPPHSFAWLQLDEHSAASVVDFPWKLLIDPENRRGTLFNLEWDPGETSDLSARHAQRAALLRAALLRRVLAGRGQPLPVGIPGRLSKADREALEALGYLTSTAPN